MTLHRTLTAACDHRTTHLGHRAPACTAEVEIKASTTQPYLDLADLGWSTETTDNDILTFCPDHKEDAK